MTTTNREECDVTEEMSKQDRSVVPVIDRHVIVSSSRLRTEREKKRDVRCV